MAFQASMQSTVLVSLNNTQYLLVTTSSQGSCCNKVADWRETSEQEEAEDAEILEIGTGSTGETESVVGVSSMSCCQLKRAEAVLSVTS